MSKRAIETGRTIYNLSTGNLYNQSSGISIIRISGPSAFNAIECLTKDNVSVQHYKPRELKRCSLYHPTSNNPIDKAMCVRFDNPNSFTGEDTVELHVHGSKSVVDGVFSALDELPDFRLSYRGEFTKRAYENDKLDLIEIEGMADLLNAKTEAQRLQALNLLSGTASQLVNTWRHDLVKLRAQVEAILDFGDDEEDVIMEEEFFNTLQIENKKLQDDIKLCLDDIKRSKEIIREGIQVSIIGPPNAGKSSLINTLSNRDVAIVTNVPGTTRDIINVPLDIHGYATIVSDTAGLRNDDEIDLVEKIGIQKTLNNSKKADLNVLVYDVETLKKENICNSNDNNNGKNVIENGVNSNKNAIKPDIIVLNKIDLIFDKNEKNNSLSDSCIRNLSNLDGFNISSDCSIVEISCKNDIGINDLLNTLKVKIDNLISVSNEKYEESGILSRKRHRARLKETVAALEHVDEHVAAGLTANDDKLVLIAEELKIATAALEKLTGKIDVEDVLDVLFDEFCIGK
jgi:tRNA modification GTPase